VNNLPSIIFLGIVSTFLLLTCPSHLILWTFINFAIYSPFITIHLFIISNSPNIPILDRPINLALYFPFENS
jgi:hypothetical protein